MALKVLPLLALLALSSAEKTQSRWSRQISSYTADISDWVPLSGPTEREAPQIRRQAVAEPRIMSEPFPGFVKPAGFSQDAFLSRGFYNSPSNRQLYLQSVPSAQQNYISEQGFNQGFNQGLKFGLTQPNYPLSQGFVAPQFNFDNIPQIKPRPQTLTNQVKFETSPSKTNPPVAHQAPVKPFTSQVKINHETPKYVDGYRAENSSDSILAKKPQSLQKIKYELADKSKETFGSSKPKVEREEVQLLYVPLDSLNRGQFNFRNPLPSAQVLNAELYNPRPNPLMQNLAAELQTPLVQPMDTFNSQEFLTNFNSRLREFDQVPKFSTATTPFTTTSPTTTAKPKKLKPHQPPLAIFSTHDGKNDQVKVGDVLYSLKNANTVAVLDSVNPLNAPKVFIGPSSLVPPENYVKFELPYLSNIENIDKKLKQLPFFVAPLSYNTPQGFAKIPFPSPHVGSVVINSLIKETPTVNKPSYNNIYSNHHSRPTQYRQEQQRPITQKPIISYYSTSAPKENPSNYEQSFYSIEPQDVSTLRPLKGTESNIPIIQSTPQPYKTGSYFLSNHGNQFNPSQYVNFPQETNYKTPEPAKIQNVFKPESTTTPRTTVTTTTKPSTYPTQLLETHNPYSINQAFHLSTPVDYQNFFDEYKEAYASSGPKISTPSITISSTPAPADEKIKPEQPKVEQPTLQVSQNYNQQPPQHVPQNYQPQQQLQQVSPNYQQQQQKQQQQPQQVSQNYQQEPSPQVSQNYERQPPQQPSQNYQQEPSPQVSQNYEQQPPQQVSHYYQQQEQPKQVTQNYQQQQQPQQVSQYYEKQQPTQQVSPNYLQNYTPEIQHESEIQNTRYPAFNTDDYLTKTAQNVPIDQTNSNKPVEFDDRTKIITNESQTHENTGNLQSQPDIPEIHTSENAVPETSAGDYQDIKPSSEYSHYDTAYNSQEIVSSTSSTTTTTTRRSPIRTRGRPRYPTTKPESQEYTTRATYTRRPLRERKPLPTRSRYEPNRITTEAVTRKPIDSSESTTKFTRSRTRGRIHYKASENEETYTRRNKPSSKENDLAYQRDVLHQNYPVTLMERTSTVDIEAITEPTAVSSNNVEVAKAEDTEDAYSNDKLSITGPINSNLEDQPLQYTTAIHSVTEVPYVSNVPNRGEDYAIRHQNSATPQETAQSYEEVKEERYFVQRTPEQIPENQDKPDTEANVSAYSNNDEFETNKQEEVTNPSDQDTKVASQELGQEQENIVETTPSYNRVRVRPGVIRQYHQTSATESSRTERRKPVQPITYRPAFDRRRTTMRIEEIEADLKTKQVHVRPEFQNYKQPVYNPEPSTESSPSTTTTEASTKRGQIKRRRPSYATTSTEATLNRRPYEAKNRFRGRRPTEKPTDKPEVQTDASSTTVKNNIYSRYSNRPRLSERYNKKPEAEDQIAEDQDSNYSINRPKYAEPETDRWSPNISGDSFKPYNPNDIDEQKKDPADSDGQSKDDIITARNEYEDILISVTPAYNNRVNKKMPDIPPTLEALVEQSKVTLNDSADTMSTFESMLEEVMKSLEEQDENEYTSNVKKHKGGEIGEIPPERVISSGENYSLKSTTPGQEENTTPTPDNNASATVNEEVPNRKNRRRGFWKKVKVRPVTEGIDVAESQYYPHVVNHLSQKNSIENSGKGNSKVTVTTYKPNYQFLKDFFETHEDALDVITNIDIPKITAVRDVEINTESLKANAITTTRNEVATTEKFNPGDMDLGTGSPDPTFDDTAYYSEPTEPTGGLSTAVDRSDGFSFMDYLFGVTSPDDSYPVKNETKSSEVEMKTTTQLPKDKSAAVETEVTKVKTTTESSYVPEEMTAETVNDNTEDTTETIELLKNQKPNDVTDQSIGKVESSSVASFMDPANVISTSMSTEVSHETEICFRGKCIKTNNDLS